MCFAGAGLSRCLDLRDLLGGPVSSRPPRCADQCADSQVCVRPDERAQLVRLSVVDSPAADPRTVLHQGPRLPIARDVVVGPLQATAWWAPQALPWLTDALASSTISISLALAFLNMLPIPRLDGDEIVDCLVDALSEANAPREDGVLAAVLAMAARTSMAGSAVVGGERYRRVLGTACAIAASFSIAVTLADGLVHRPP